MLTLGYLQLDGQLHSIFLLRETGGWRLCASEAILSYPVPLIKVHKAKASGSWINKFMKVHLVQ